MDFERRTRTLDFAQGERGPLSDARPRYRPVITWETCKGAHLAVGKRVSLAKSRVDPIAQCQRSLDSYLQEVLYRPTSRY